VVQTFEEHGIAREPRGQELERHRLAELRVVGAIDLAHAAGAEDAGDAVTARDDRARRELRLHAAAARRPRHVGLETRSWLLIGRGRDHEWDARLYDDRDDAGSLLPRLCFVSGERED